MNENKNLILANYLIITIFLFCVATLWIIYNWGYDEWNEINNPKIKPKDLTFNSTLMNKSYYQINIDCEWVSEHLNDNKVSFHEKVVVLCKEFFPELFEGGREE